MRGDVPGFVVAPQQGDLVGVLHLQAQQVLEGLHGMVAPVHEVPDEHVGVGGDLSACVRGCLPVRNSSSRSKNCPWISPHTVTGEHTGCTFDSSRRISFAFSQTSLRSLSWRHLHSSKSLRYLSMFIFFQITICQES